MLPSIPKKQEPHWSDGVQRFLVKSSFLSSFSKKISHAQHSPAWKKQDKYVINHIFSLRILDSAVQRDKKQTSPGMSCSSSSWWCLSFPAPGVHRDGCREPPHSAECWQAGQGRWAGWRGGQELGCREGNLGQGPGNSRQAVQECFLHRQCHQRWMFLRLLTQQSVAIY